MFPIYILKVWEMMKIGTRKHIYNLKFKTSIFGKKIYKSKSITYKKITYKREL